MKILLLDGVSCVYIRIIVKIKIESFIRTKYFMQVYIHFGTFRRESERQRERERERELNKYDLARLSQVFMLK